MAKRSKPEPTNEIGDAWHLSQHLLVCADLVDFDAALETFKSERPKIIVESDPARCDAIIEMWEALTGFSATMQGYNHLYNQVRQMRGGNSALSCGQLSRKQQREGMKKTKGGCCGP